MQANELRIGNWVLRKNNNEHQIQTRVNITYFNLVFEYPNDYTPIPLTPEILEKCGALDFGYHWEIGDVHLDWSSKMVDTGERMGISVVGSPHIKYLHLLQNLIYAKTGEELPVAL